MTTAERALVVDAMNRIIFEWLADGSPVEDQSTIGIMMDVRDIFGVPISGKVCMLHTASRQYEPKSLSTYIDEIGGILEYIKDCDGGSEWKPAGYDGKATQMLLHCLISLQNSVGGNEEPEPEDSPDPDSAGG